MDIRYQSSRLLVNLTCNDDNIRPLLRARCPPGATILALVTRTAPEEQLLRNVTFLANLAVVTVTERCRSLTRRRRPGPPPCCSARAPATSCAATRTPGHQSGRVGRMTAGSATVRAQHNAEEVVVVVQVRPVNYILREAVVFQCDV